MALETERADEIEQLSELGEFIAQQHADAVGGWRITHGELTVDVESAQIVEVMNFLKGHSRCQFVSFIDLCAVDWPGRAHRFDVVYHLLSPVQNLRVRVKVETDERTPVPSIVDVFAAADWFEREAYDLYGVLFSGHPDLRRILTDYGFDGYPMRKDFPLTGYVELRYDDEQKRVVYDHVQLPQAYRDFEFLSPWEGTDYVLPGDEKAS